MEKLYKLLDEVLTFDLIQATVSGPRKKGGILKVKIRPVIIRDDLVFQASAQEEKKIFHNNYKKKEMVRELGRLLDGEFSQLQIQMPGELITVLAGKKGNVTIRRKKQETKAAPRDLSHDRKKTYLLPTDQPLPFLVDLGLMTSEGKLVKGKQDKFRQINRFLEFVADVVPHLPTDRQITVVDFGCGKSYLTFAMYYFLHEQKGFAVRMIGLDLKEDVIASCSKLAKKYGYEGLTFLVGDIASYEGMNSVDMVVSLHACDTATDYALYKAISWSASVILSVPCCQHECNQTLKAEGVLAPALKYGIIKERMAALFTDAMRANLLEQQGYQVQLLEFIDMEHTPKNILIRAVRGQAAADPAAYEALRDFLHTPLILDRLLGEEKKA